MCVNGSDISLVECVKVVNQTTSIFKYIQGASFLITCLLGTTGNLATLCSISFAAHKHLLEIDKNFKNSTIFVLNLLLIDLIRCITYTFSNGYVLMAGTWPFGLFWCQLCGYLVIFTSVSDLTALNLVGLARCLNLMINTKWVNWTDRGIYSVLLIIMSWLPGMILVIPNLTGFSSGWCCIYGVCDATRDMNVPFRKWYIGFKCTSIFLLCVWYFIIWVAVKSSKNAVQKLGNPNNEMDKRNSKISRSILLLLLTTIGCHLYWAVDNLFSVLEIYDPIEFPSNYYVMNTIYESQFSLNFLIYAFKNDEYRRAYIVLWKNVSASCRLQKQK